MRGIFWCHLGFLNIGLLAMLVVFGFGVRGLGQERESSPRLTPELEKFYQQLSSPPSFDKYELLSHWRKFCFDPRIPDFLLGKDLTFEMWQDLGNSCYLIRTRDVDFYIVRTKSDRFWIYKAVSNNSKPSKQKSR